MTFNLYDSGYSSVGCSQRILFNIHRRLIRSWYNKYFQVFYECTKCIPTKTYNFRIPPNKHRPEIKRYWTLVEGITPKRVGLNQNPSLNIHTYDPWLLTWFDLMYSQTYPWNVQNLWTGYDLKFCLLKGTFPMVYWLQIKHYVIFGFGFYLWDNVKV